MINPMLTVAIQAAKKAGKIVLDGIDHLNQMEIIGKNSNEFVTQIDKVSEETIIAELQNAYPSHAFLAEESGHISGIAGDQYCWIIDPLDGTRNYMQGYSPFSISIALMKDRELLLGVIFDPTRDEVFTAVKEQGAYLNGHRIHVSPSDDLKTALIGTGFPLEKNAVNMDNYLREFSNIFTHCTDVRRDGCSSLDLAYVACGRLNGFWEFGLRIWHVAAAALIIQEAGGIVTDFQDSDQYLNCGNIIAGNAVIHKMLLELVNKN